MLECANGKDRRGCLWCINETGRVWVYAMLVGSIPTVDQDNKMAHLKRPQAPSAQPANAA